MRAIWLEQFSQPAEIKVEEVHLPKLAEGDILVKVAAAGVNPSDVKYAAGLNLNALLPRTPGRDFAGVVERGPEHLVGREVFGTGGDLGISRDGTHAQYLAVPVEGVSLKPEQLTLVQAAAVGVPYIAAYKAVVELASLERGETVCIVGGSGAVGTAAAQIAKWIGATVLATTRSADNISDPTDSVDRYITLPDEEIDIIVNEYTGGKGANVVFNTVGGYTFDAGVKALSRGGRMVCIAAQGPKPVSFDLMHFYKNSLHFHGLDTLDLTAKDCAPILDHLRAGFELGAFKVAVAETFPLDQASKAYQHVLDGGIGKVVLTM
jgi:NADPH:quinone reductase